MANVKPGRAVVRMVDGSEWVGAIRKGAPWRRIMGMPVPMVVLENVEAIVDGAHVPVDGLVMCSPEHIVTVQVVA